MDKFLKTISFISAFAFIAGAVGCNNKNNQAELKYGNGGYVEEKIESLIVGRTDYPSELFLYDGKKSFFNSLDSQMYYISNEDMKIVKVDDNFLTKCTVKMDEGTVIAANKDHCLAMLYVRDSDEPFYGIIDKDGSFHEIIIDGYMKDAEFSDDGRIFVVTDSCLCEISTENYTMKKLMSFKGTLTAFDLVDNYILILNKKDLTMFDIESNTEIEAPEALNDLFDKLNMPNVLGFGGVNICKGSDGSMLIGSSDGIFSYKMGANNVEQLLDGNKFSLGSNEHYVSSIFCDENDDIWVVFSDGSVMKYHYDSDLDNNVRAVLKICSIDDSPIVKQYINLFSKQHRDIQVDYQFIHRNGETYGDSMKKLTTMLMSGDSPDIFLLDGMDINNLVDRNVFMDLSKSEKLWNSADSLLDNIAKWNSNEKKIYSITTRFRIPAVGGDKETLESIYSFKDIADRVENIRNDINPDHPIISMMDIDTPTHFGIICGDNDFIYPEKISNEQLREYYDSCYKIVRNAQGKEAMSMNVSFIDHPADEYDFAVRFYTSIMNDNCIAIGTLNNFNNDLNFVTSVNTSKNVYDISFRYGLNDDSTQFIPNCTFGILEAGKSHDAAIEFLSFTLGEECQKLECNEGFPVNKKILENLYIKNEDINSSGSYVMRSYDGSRTDTIVVEWMNNEEVNIFKNYIETLDEPIIIDVITREIIDSLGEKMIMGEISASEAADEAFRQLTIKIRE